MSTQLVLGTVGAAAGFVVGGPAGAQLGFMAGSLVGAVVDPPKGPGPGDLSAPSIQQGAALPRVYGRVRVPVNPVWVSDFTATANDTGGKGGPPDGSAGYSYSLDLLGTLADGLNVIAFTRIWVNKKLVYTALAESTDASVTASGETDSWSAVELFTGAVDQVPWGVYETSVTTANAVAYRHQCTIGFTGLQCGGSKTPPLVEVEVITQGTEETGEFLLLLHGYTGDLFTDSSSYARTPVYSAAATQGTGPFSGGVYYPGGSTGYALQYAVPFGAPQDITYDAFVTFHSVTSGTDSVIRHGTSSNLWTVNSQSSSGLPYLEVDRSGSFGVDYTSEVLELERAYHLRVCIGIDGTFRFFLDGDLRFYDASGGNISGSGGVFWAGGYIGATGSPSDSFTLSEVAIRPLLASTSNFTPPTVPFGEPAATWTPGVEDLQDVVDAELAVNEAANPADHDTSALAGTTVTGFTAAGSAASTIAQLGDIFYFDCIPGNPIRYVPRGEAAVATIPFEDTGAGMGQSGKPFSGIKRGNNDELPAVFGLSAPNILQDHDIVFERGDRLTTDGPDVRKFSTSVVLEPSEVKGRAITATLMARAASHTAEFALSDEYAKLEPGDACTVTAEDTSTYSLLIRRLTYADGIKQIAWELNDTSALVETGLTDETYTSSIVVAAPVDSNLVAIDGPILLDADDDAGAYTAIEGEGSEDYPGGVVRRSVDDLDFSEIVTTHGAETVVGTASTALDDWTGGYVWDEASSVTVTVGTGQTLSSSTADAMQLDRTVNAAFIGAHGRWEVIRFRTATLDSTAVYTLTGLLRGCRGTEAHIGTHAIGDTFVLATTAGLRRMPGEIVDLGATRYLKAVTNGRPAASATSESFVNEGVGLLPFSPTDLRAARNGSNDITFTWARRTRLAVRYGGSGGSYTPLGEGSERYEIDIYASNAYATVLRTISAISETAAYTAAEQTADGLTPGATVYARVYQLSDAIGRGSYLEASA
jgi:hypothetical protein